MYIYIYNLGQFKKLRRLLQRKRDFKKVNIATLRCCFAEGGTVFFLSAYRT